jgi:phytoene dehydrogenase-like protein
MIANGRRGVVIGGGLTGLAAAAYAARAGHRVTLLERAQTPGGRAATHEKEGYRLNLGPHALYLGGPATRALAELGVTPRGTQAPADGYGLDGDALRTLPAGPVTLLTTSLLPLAGKLEIGRLLASLGRLDVAALAGTTVAAFIARLRSPEARALLGALIRVSSYCADTERLSAGAAIAQLRRAVEHGVMYLDGGWETLVHGLRAAAETAGVTIETGAKAEAVEHVDGAVRAVRLAGGRTLPADAAILAAGPDAARAVCPDVPAIAAWAEAAVPCHASCLDVALARLPDPRRRFVLGIDRPVYFSVHSAVAKLAPEGGALIHVARYGYADAPAAVERELEGLLDRAQPGWRDVVVHRRFLPAMVVAHDIPQAARGGLAGRPGPEVPGVVGLLVAGDWVGPVGMLADAGLASARAAVRAIAARPAERTGFSAAAAAG